MLVAAILNACWLVRHYRRGGRTLIQREERQEAIHKLGLLIRDAFNSSEDFEPLLVALHDGLNPEEHPPF